MFLSQSLRCRSRPTNAARARAKTFRLFLEFLESRSLPSAPVVVLVDPPKNENAAPVSTDISVTFNQAIDGNTVNPQSLAVHSSQRGQLVGSLVSSVTTSGPTVTLDPAFNFFPGELVQITATSGIRNAGGEGAVPFVSQFQAGALGGTGSFADSGQSLPNLNSSGVALGDIDGDGDLDAFVSNDNNQAEQVWRNNGNGSFTLSQNLDGGYSRDVALGDLDGDGDLDAFVANRSGQGNRVWLNDGAGNFTDSGQVLGNFESFGVALGDLDGDGDLDAFVACGRYQPDRVWLNDGHGHFSDSGQALGGFQYGNRVALGDLDGDGDLDAVVANSGNTVSQVWLNNGLGVFSAGQTLTLNGLDVALGDVDGDGDLDVLLSLSGGTRVWRNNGAGTFTDSGQNLAGYRSSLALADLDGDGDLDLFAANSGQGNRVWFNNGAGIFSDSGQQLGIQSSPSVALGDLDGDGDLDAFIANGQSQGNRVLFNQEATLAISPALVALGEGDSGSTIFIFTVTRGVSTNGTTTVDFNVTGSGSNPADANDFVGGVFPSGQVTFNNGDSTKTIQVAVSGDINFEPDETFAVTLSHASGGAHITTATATGLIANDDVVGGVDFGDAPNTYRTTRAAAGPSHVAVGPRLGDLRDTESDGQPTANADGDDNNGSDDEDGVVFGSVRAGQINATVTVNVQEAPSGAKLDAWIDFNGDGNFNGAGEQIFKRVVVTEGDNVLTFVVPADAAQGATFARFRLSSAGGLKTTGGAADGEVEDHVVVITAPGGTGIFVDSGQLLANQDSRSVAVGDLDGDGDLDAIVANYNQSEQVWRNNGNGSFTLSQSFGSGLSLDIALGDLDGDGDLDAFVANRAGQGNRVWLNDGAGHFTDSGQVLGNFESFGVALGDLDGDGDLDAFVACGRYQPDRVWLNDGHGHFSDSGQALGGFQYGNRVALGDLDGDGDLDAVVANSANTVSQVWLNNSLGVFSAGQTLTLNGLDVALGDVDGDGDLDVLLSVSGGTRVWRNNGAATFSDSGQLLSGYRTSLALGDLDGDGDLDLFAANSDQGNRVWRNNGAGIFTDSGQSLGSRRAPSVALGDLDGDGDLDAFIANGQSQGNRVLFNQSAPIADAGGPYVIDEGSALTLDASGSSDPDTASLTYRWDVDGDGDFDGNVSGVAPTLTWADLVALGIKDGPDSRTITVQVSDGISSDTASATLTVNNVAPTITAFTSDSPLEDPAIQGDTVSISGAFTDPGTFDSHTAVVDWGDGSPLETVTISENNGSGSVSGSHVYSTGGLFGATLTLADDDGGVDQAAVTVVVSGARINNGVLEIVGTQAADNIIVTDGNGQFRVTTSFLAGPPLTFNGGGVQSIHILGLGGNDNIVIAGNISIPAFIEGGDGNDQITSGAGNDLVLAGAGDDSVSAGDGNDIVIGGGGNDNLDGGTGSNILIGGAGSDTLSGGSGDDLLIAGFTSYDDNLVALNAIFREWTSTAPYADRVQNLLTGAGSNLNGIKLEAGTTVFDDGNVDSLTGNLGMDLFFANLSGSGVFDLITDRTSQEIVVEL
jgi:large repetitive protein